MATRLEGITEAQWEQIASQAHYDIATIAALCRVSPRQLERFFNARFQMTPTEWRRRLRARIASRRLAEGWSTKAVAAELHFASSSNFCRDFKLVYGLTPGVASLEHVLPQSENVAQ